MKCIYSDVFLILTGLFIGLGSFTSFVFWCYIQGGCTTYSSLIGNPLLPFLFGLSIVPMVVFPVLLVQRRSLYVDYSLFVFNERGKNVPRKCKICAKHPLYQKRHAKKVHNLKITTLDENFEDCGCQLCFKAKQFSSHDWLEALTTYLKTGKA